MVTDSQLAKRAALFVDQMERSGLIAGVRDAQGNYVLQVTDDPAAWIGDERLATEPEVSSLDVRTARIEGAAFAGSDINCSGDSLTFGAGYTNINNRYPRRLQTLFENAGDDRTSSNQGRSGADSAQIAGAYLGKTVTVQVTGGQIPASGAFTLDALPSPNVCYSVSGSFSVAGWIRGVHVTITNTGVTRTEAGDAVDVLPVEVFTPDMSFCRDKIQVKWWGRNDDWDTGSTGQTLLDRYIQSSKNLDLFSEKTIVLGVTNNSSETSGTTRHTNIVAANDLLRDALGVRYVPIRDLLIAQGLDRAGITPTAQDTTDIGNDVIPDSLRSDATHLNDDGYRVVAEIVFEKIQFMEANQWP